MDKKERFTKILKKHGYRSISHFCLEMKIPQSNMTKRLNGNQNVELPLLFNWSNTLHEPIDTLLDIFYPEEMKENKKLSK